MKKFLAIVVLIASCVVSVILINLVASLIPPLLAALYGVNKVLYWIILFVGAILFLMIISSFIKLMSTSSVFLSDKVSESETGTRYKVAGIVIISIYALNVVLIIATRGFIESVKPAVIASVLAIILGINFLMVARVIKARSNYYH